MLPAVAGSGDIVGDKARIAILGFGTVGQSVARLVLERHADRLELTHIFNRSVTRKRVPWVPASVAWTEDIDDVLATHVDVVVELMGGIAPAHDYVKRALESGASVVT